MKNHFIADIVGVDEPLARHVAHLFIRDPVASLCLEDLYKDDEGSSNLFEVRCNTSGRYSLKISQKLSLEHLSVAYFVFHDRGKFCRKLLDIFESNVNIQAAKFSK